MANPTTVNNAAASLPLADVHLPAAPGYWPLAWGWWICILTALIGIIFLIYKFSHHLKQQRARNEALHQLKSLNNPAQLCEINLLLRQAAMSYYPRQDVASLTGKHWLAFLDSQLPDKHRGFVALSDNWQQGLFSPLGLELGAFDQCYQQATLWLKKAQLPPKGKFSPAQPEVSDA